MREQLINGITEKLSVNYDIEKVEVKDVFKVNRTVEELIIKTHDKQAAPALVLEYIIAKAEEEGLEAGVDYACALFKNAYESSFDMTDLKFEKEKLYACLINKAENENLIENAPHRDFLDLTIICRLLVGESDDREIASVVVTNEVLRGIGLNEEELLNLAINNTRELFPVSFRSMSEILSEIMGFDIAEECSEMDNPKMHVLGNTKGINGAISIVYNDVLEDISKKIGESFYIIPSSIHECIVLPINDQLKNDGDRLSEMISEVNSTQVDESERLSNNLYMFIPGKGIVIAKESEVALI